MKKLKEERIKDAFSLFVLPFLLKLISRLRKYANKRHGAEYYKKLRAPIFSPRKSTYIRSTLDLLFGAVNDLVNCVYTVIEENAARNKL